jgi:predicted dehydrogenase
MHPKEITRRDVLKTTSATALAASSAAGLVASIAETSRADTPAPAGGQKVRIGVVGGGFGASFHWHEDPNCVVTGVTDLRPDRRQILRDRYQCDQVYDSLEAMLKEARDIDAVAIFTEAPNHEKHVRMSMQRGWHVISAVPACLTLEEAERLKEIKEKTGLKYMMAETSYYRHHCIAARQLHQEGKFGELFYSEVEYYHPHIGHTTSPLSFHNGKRTWRYGYPPMLYPTHSTGLLIGVTKERLTEVSCLGWGNSENPSLKDNDYKNPFNAASALFKTDRGHACRCNVFWDGTAHGERAQWFGKKLTFYMPGSGGQPFRLQGPDAPKWSKLPDYWHMVPKTMTHSGGHGGSHPFLTHEFVSALVEDREPVIDLYESLAMTVPGIVAHQSALKGGEQLKIPSFEQA